MRSDHQWRMNLEGSNSADAPSVPHRVAILNRPVRRDSHEASVLRFDQPRNGRRSHELKATALPFESGQDALIEVSISADAVRITEIGLG